MYLQYGMNTFNLHIWARSTLLIFMAISFVLGGCGIFETRSAEEPGTGTGSGFQQPDRPELVINNLQSAVANLNTVNYIRSLNADMFEFTPSSAALDDDPQLWQGWTVIDEETYFNNLRASAQNQSGHVLQLSNEQRTTLPDGGERITASYSLSVFHNRTSTSVPNVATGNFIIDLVQDESGLWSIASWTDNGAGSSFTWSDFKAVFYRD